MKTTSPRQPLRIILAIAAKDILDAMKNRTLLTLAFGILILMFSAKAMPVLLSLRGLLVLGIYDPAGMPALQSLADREDMKLVRFDSEQEMKSQLVNTSELMIGVVLPVDEELKPREDQVALDANYPNWASPARVQKQIIFFEEVLSSTFEAQVHLDVNGNVIYPNDEPGLHLVMVTQTATLMIVLVGLIMVPYLFLDEKEQRTMDALLVSPANYSQLVIGKGIAGVFYCLVAAGVVMLFNFRYIVHWELTLLAILLGGAFSVLIGLLLGILVESQGSLGMWTGLMLVLLIGPSVMKSFSHSQLPAAVDVVFSWTPGVAFSQLFKASLYKPIHAAAIFKDASILVTAAVVIFVLLVWRIRRMDR